MLAIPRRAACLLIPAVVLVVAPAWADAPGPAEPETSGPEMDAFEQVWSTVRERVPQLQESGLDWEQIREEFAPRVRNAEDREEVRAILTEMLSKLGQSHLAILPAEAADAVLTPGGDDGGPPGSAGLSVRVLDGRAVVVDVVPGGAADQAGLAPGWALRGIDGEPLAPMLERISESYAGSTLADLMLSRAVEGRLDGPVGGTRTVDVLDGADQARRVTLTLGKPRGELTRFGRLPPTPVWVSFQRLGGDVGHLAFNAFLDPGRLMPAFEEAITSCGECTGIVLDLRGNPGGIAAMSMGLAGWFVSERGRYLGTMKRPEATIRFAIFPRAEPFTGPLAVLVDGLTGSTAEILAGGLQDIGRARIFGTRTAGAALPSVIHRLPTGDGFQFPIASYRSAEGDALEGRGVTPDEVVVPTRDGLLEGRDPALDAAVDWLRSSAQGGSSAPTAEESSP
jgi:carboxyl-terminal processing protease